MSRMLLLLVLAVQPQPSMPTADVITVENIDCISRQVTASQARAFYLQARAGKEAEAFGSVSVLVQACSLAHGWSVAEARSAFRVSVMDGWLLEEGLIGKIQSLGDFRPMLDRYYDDHASTTGRYLPEDVFQSGTMDKDLTAAGYPEEPAKRQWVHRYFEWRAALRHIEADFRGGVLGQ